MLILNVCIILLFVGLGIAFKYGKGLDLVAGYNTMPAEEKEKIDKEKLSKYMTGLMLSLAACWCVLSIGIELSRMWLFWVGFALFIGVTILFVVLMNTKNRLQK